jgi:hypothetical protein
MAPKSTSEKVLLSMKSMAPRLSASTVAGAPWEDRVDSTITGSGVLGHQAVERTKAAHAWHLEIEGNDVGLPFGEAAEQLLAAGGGAHHADALIGREQAHQPLAYEERVVGNGEANRSHAVFL